MSTPLLSLTNNFTTFSGKSINIGNFEAFLAKLMFVDMKKEVQ
jgi:hypothetical protein